MKIFVSSTFKDMHAERDMLQLDVFPEIEDFARDYGEELTFIDLRWGINTHSMEDDQSAHKILSVCLDEIDNSKPYFIAFLGERYGWIPDKKLIENAVKQKAPEYSYLAELEKSVTALEIEYGALAEKGLIDHCLFYFRNPLPLEKLSPEHRALYCSEGEEAQRRLETLKSKIISSGGNIKFYSVDWDQEKNCVTGLDELKKQISDDLKELIKKDFGEKKPLPWQEKAVKEAEFFLYKQMLKRFAARSQLGEDITTEIFSGSSNLIVLKGKYGFGKSTLVAKLAADAQERNAHVLPIVCGLSKNTSKYLDVFRQIAYYLENLLNLPHKEEQSFEPKRSKLPTAEWIEYLAKLFAAADKKLTEPVVIFIDDADTLPYYHDFQFFIKRLLTGLPQNIVFVLACTDDFAVSAKLTAKIKYVVYELDALGPKEKELVLAKLESLYHKELPEEVKNKLLAKKESSNPLYLAMMYHRLLMFDSDDFKEIVRLGDGIEGQMEYMLRLIEQAPDDIDGVAAMLMEEAASRINEELCREVLRLMAVTRRGLRQSDLVNIYKKRNEERQAEFSLVDFYRLKKYMRPYFFDISDGRYDFAYESFRSGILKNLSEAELKELQEEIFALLDTLPDRDPVHLDEYTWFAWKCDKKQQFLMRLGKYTNEFLLDLYANSTAKGLHDICLQDKGQWLIDVLKEAIELDSAAGPATESQQSYLKTAIYRLLNIICYYLYSYFNSSIDEIKVLAAIREQALRTAEYLAQKYGTPKSIDYMRLLAHQIASLYELSQMYDEALAYYQKTLEICDTWGPGADRYEAIYNRIADVYKECGKYDQALEYYRKAIELVERQAKEFWNNGPFPELISYYERAAEFCQEWGKPEAMTEFLNKANSLKELQQRIADDGRYFGLTGNLFKGKLDEAAEHKDNGKIAEALQAYEEAFEVLENELRKWNKTEVLMILGELYEQLADESEAVSSKLAQKCTRRSLKIKEYLTEESVAGEWYYYFDTKWLKVEIKGSVKK